MTNWASTQRQLFYIESAIRSISTDPTDDNVKQCLRYVLFRRGFFALINKGVSIIEIGMIDAVGYLVGMLLGMIN